MAKLLLLDDDEGDLEWMSEALRGQGHEVRCFSSGRAALAGLREWTPDLIVADVLMPEIDGIAFGRLVRRYHVPLVIVSIAQRQVEAVLAGAVGYVHKPATANEVRAAVVRALHDTTSPSTILIVDDDVDVRQLFRSC